MIVEVTQEDIRRGVEAVDEKLLDRGSHCPIALALAREIGEEAYVEGDVWWLDDAELIPLPLRARVWIRMFDDNLPVKPFRFRTRKPTP